MSTYAPQHSPPTRRSAPPRALPSALPAPSPLPSPRFLPAAGPAPTARAAAAERALAAGGASLAPAVRGEMEGRFRHDFSRVRIHDDALAHASARQLQAAAYTHGDHIVFGSGRYDPHSRAGRHLLAHELAHTIQHGGIQARSLAGAPLDDHGGLEHEADRAADAVLRGDRPPALTTLGRARLSRKPDSHGFPDQDDPTAMQAVRKLGFVAGISTGTLGKGTALKVTVKTPLPVLPKGHGDWVKAQWDRYASGGNLVFRSEVGGGQLASIKERAGVDYLSTWLNQYGFADLAELGAAIAGWLKSGRSGQGPSAALKPGLERAARNFSHNRLGGSQEANIDHIVEKQVGGASIPENMQIINADENQESGRKLSEYITGQAREILDAVGRSGVTFIALNYRSVRYAPSARADAYDIIEQLLRDGKLKPTPASSAATGAPKTGAKRAATDITLQSGKATDRISVAASGSTPIADDGTNDAARRLIPGLDLQRYQRAAGGRSGAAADQVEASIDAARLKHAIRRAGGKGKQADMTLDARRGKAVDREEAEGSEVRQLSFSRKTPYLDFLYPYLSPGRFTRLGLGDDGSFAAEGYIQPTLKFLKRLDVALSKEAFALTGQLGPERFQPPFPGFTVTASSLTLQLAPEFRPSGGFAFRIGPDDKPYLTGAVTAGLDGDGLTLSGGLASANIPGVEHATGTVRYSAAAGWSGELTASTSSLPKAKRTAVVFGFSTTAGRTMFYAHGAIELDIGAGQDLTLIAAYRGDRLQYHGTLLWARPIKLVDQVALDFTYDGVLLSGCGAAEIDYLSKFHGRLAVSYRKQGDEPGKLSGAGLVALKSGKAEGSGIALEVDPDGVISGKGTITYAFSDQLKPSFGVTLHPDGHLSLNGKVEITHPVQLFRRFPEDGGERDLIKVNQDFIIPGPFPGLADPMVHLGAGVHFSYGFGPGQLVDTQIEGSFDPLAENPHARLRFTSTFEVPGQVGVNGILEAGLGIALAGGLAGKVHGGLRIEPGFSLRQVTRIPVSAAYDQGEISFSGRLEMQGALALELAIRLYAHAEAVGGAFEKDFLYDVKKYSYDLGQEMTLTIAKIGYSTKTGFKPPELADIRITPGGIDPIAMVERIADSAAAALRGQA